MLKPTPPPYDALEWVTWPLPERAKAVCRAWALQGYGAPLGAYVFYALKAAGFAFGWWWCVRHFSPDVGWASVIAIQKAVIFSLLFEVLGLGCGSGPLTGRYWPPVAGFLSFLRPGTTRLPVVRAFGTKRTVLDVALYAALLGWAGVLLTRVELKPLDFVPGVVLLGLLGLRDKTVFLAARAEHYGVLALVFSLSAAPLPGVRFVQLCLWFFAGVSKLNRHFPTVVTVMVSNSPITRFQWLRKLMYRKYPDDLRPSALATVMAHVGTSFELGIPLVLLFAHPGPETTFGLVLVVMLHTFITSNVPMGVPIEWNLTVVYLAFALFLGNPATGLEGLEPGLGVLLFCTSFALPLVGNFVPRAISFLLAMRYYAGNWAFSVWLFRKDAAGQEAWRKLEKLTTSSQWVYTQLDRFYDRRTAVGLVGKVMAFRMMHLHGRLLAKLVGLAVDDLRNYEWLDGEIVAGLALGWNFGEGHLHQEQLLEALQAQCGFAPGEVRCIFAESQPLLGQGLSWRVVDGATGRIAEGEAKVSELLELQPWGEKA